MVLHSATGANCAAVRKVLFPPPPICIKRKLNCNNVQQNKLHDSLEHLQRDVDVMKLLLALIDVL